MTLSQKFGEVIDIIRRTKQLSQEQLAQRLKVKQQTVSSYLKGNALDLDMAFNLAKSVDEDFGDLIKALLTSEKTKTLYQSRPTWTSAELSRRAQDNRTHPARQRLIEIINHCDDKQVAVILQAIQILTEKRQDGVSEKL